MSDSSISTAVQGSITINDNSVTNYVSPTHLTEEEDSDEMWMLRVTVIVQALTV